MTHTLRYCAAMTVAGLLCGLVTALPASALPNCNVPNPPPACGPPDPPPPPPPPPTTDNITFTWQLTQLRAAGNGAVTMNDTDTTDESSTSLVTLDACASTAKGGTSYPGISSYKWSFSNGNPTITTPTCSTSWRRPLRHVDEAVTVTLTVIPQSGSPFSLPQTIHYRDVVIASLGDSAAAGQGAPDGVNTSGSAYRISEACHRSGFAASAQAALRIQNTLGPNVTVHFWFLACSGASITAANSATWSKYQFDTGGMLDPFKPKQNADPPLQPQVDRLNQLISQTRSNPPAAESGLPVDRLLITIGANDTHWATVAVDCMKLAVLGGIGQNLCIDGYAARVQLAMQALPSHFQALHAALDKSLVAPDHVYLTQYFDPFDSLSTQPLVCPGEVLAGPYLRSWGSIKVESPLQSIVQSSATGGWHFIGGIREAFQGHGVCQVPQSQRWVNSFSDSQDHQGDLDGTWHANQAGYAVFAETINDNIAGGLDHPVAPTQTVYLIGTDHHLYAKYWNGSSWDAWTLLGGSPSVHASLAAVSMIPGTQNVYAIGDDGQLAYKYRSNNTWSDWTPIGAPPTGVAANSGISAVSMTPGTENVYVIGSDHHVYYRYWNGSSWSAWTLLGGSPSVHATLAAVSMSPGTQNLYVLGDDGQLYDKYWSDNTWSDWISIGAPPTGVAANSGISAVSMTPGTENVYVIGSDHHVYYRYWNGSSWSAWTLLGGSPSVHASLAAVSMSPGTQDVYALGDDGQLYYKYWNSTSWSDWTSVGAPPPGVAANSDIAAAPLNR
jgi:hypothetical protein